MKKIGILTHFYNSTNYGGVLQAYALCKILEKNGFDAKQILYKHKYIKEKESFFKKILRLTKRLPQKIYGYVNKKKISALKSETKKAFEKFVNECVPHTENAYNSANINETIDNFDVFIAGSDQVWNGCEYTYYLDFVPQERQKISYAASIAKKELGFIEKSALRKSLSSFNAISVREAESVELLKDLTEKPIELVADPTLLLTANDWEEVSEERKIDGDYIFCYFLGDNKKSKKIARKFALEKGLKTVFIQLNHRLSSAFDSKYCDELLYDVSPEQFLYLIKNSKYVFTDSFHAMVLSFLFKKQYFIFKRSKQNEMSTRITSLATYFKTEHRVCFDNEKLEYIIDCPEINYEQDFTELEKIRIHSKNFLLNSLKGTKNES